MKIYKYPLKPVLQIPEGAKILAVQLQFDSPKLWALVDPEKPLVDRHIKVFGTGHEIPDGLKYIGTFQEDSLAIGHFVWHVFEACPQTGEQSK